MNYGLLRVDRNGSISRVVIVDVADEQAALARATDFADDRTVEIWCGGSRIAERRGVGVGDLPLNDAEGTSQAAFRSRTTT